MLEHGLLAFGLYTDFYYFYVSRAVFYFAYKVVMAGVMANNGTAWMIWMIGRIGMVGITDALRMTI